MEVLVTRRVSEEPVKILANASGYHSKRSLFSWEITAVAAVSRSR